MKILNITQKKIKKIIINWIKDRDIVYIEPIQPDEDVIDYFIELDNIFDQYVSVQLRHEYNALLALYTLAHTRTNQ